MQNDQNFTYWNEIGTSKKFNNPNLILEHPELISAHDSILDVGCGYGRILSELAEAGYENLFGADYAPEMIRVAAARPDLKNVNFSVCSATDLPFPDSTFDALLLFAILNCLPDPGLEVEVLKEAKRVSKKGAYIFINDFVASEALLSGPIARSDQYGVYGLVTVDEQCVMRHTSVDRMKAMTLGMQLVSWRVKTETSMNGNPVSLLSYIMQKTDD